MLYIATDMTCFFFIKWLRRDLWYWIPVKGFSGLIMVFAERLIAKAITDFTSIVQLRHPNELGGAYWTFNFLVTMASLPAAIMIYSKYEEPPSSELVEKAWITSCFLLPLGLGLLILFLTTIEPAYLKTFLSTQTAKERLTKLYRYYERVGKKDRDEKRAVLVFESNIHLWEQIEPEVRDFVEANWKKWELESPKWLTSALRSNIPLHFIPTAKGRLQETRRRNLEKKIASARDVHIMDAFKFSTSGSNTNKFQKKTQTTSKLSRRKKKSRRSKKETKSITPVLPPTVRFNLGGGEET